MLLTGDVRRRKGRVNCINGQEVSANNIAYSAFKDLVTSLFQTKVSCFRWNTSHYRSQEMFTSQCVACVFF